MAAHVLLTGVTGFVGKVVLYDLLRRREELGIGRVSVLVRPKSKPVTVLVGPRAPIADDLRWELCVRPGTKFSRVILTPRGGAPVIRSFAAGDEKKVVLDRLSTRTRDPHEIEIRVEGDAAVCGAIAETDATKKPGVVPT